jgi:phosphomannomutase
VLPIFSPGSDAICAAFTVLTHMAKTGLKSTDLYRNHQIYAQRTAEVTFPIEKMFNFFKTVLNDPPESYIAIDTFIGIKLITKDNEWIHLHLGSEGDTLQIEVFDPAESVEKQAQMIEFARNLANDYLSK